MKKFEFTLSKMLDYKNSMLEKEKNSLMNLNLNRSNIEAKIDSYEHKFDDESSLLRENITKGTTVMKLQISQFQMQNIQEHIKMFVAEKKGVDIAIEEQLKVVINLSQEVAEIEKLKENQLEEYRAKEKAEEENRVSELISQKIARRLTSA